MKKAALQQIAELESIFKQIGDSVKSCSDMQDSIIKQESLESEIVQKVDRQFDLLKSIIDDQRTEAQNTIRNLESVQEYRPPPQDLAKDTLSLLSGVKDQILEHINKQKSMTGTAKYFDILQE